MEESASSSIIFWLLSDICRPDVLYVWVISYIVLEMALIMNTNIVQMRIYSTKFLFWLSVK